MTKPVGFDDKHPYYCPHPLFAEYARMLLIDPYSHTPFDINDTNYLVYAIKKETGFEIRGLEKHTKTISADTEARIIPDWMTNQLMQLKSSGIALTINPWSSLYQGIEAIKPERSLQNYLETSQKNAACSPGKILKVNRKPQAMSPRECLLWAAIITAPACLAYLYMKSLDTVSAKEIKHHLNLFGIFTQTNEIFSQSTMKLSL